MSDRTLHDTNVQNRVSLLDQVTSSNNTEIQRVNMCLSCL